MTECFILLGSNLGNRLGNLEAAQSLLSTHAGRIIRCSSLYESAPWGNRLQPYFYNRVVVCEVDDAPTVLLTKLLQLETKLGRFRDVPMGPRTIDLDLLYYGDKVIRTKDLKVPHPEITNRRFTLLPLVEIAPFHLHPVRKVTHVQLLKECNDPLEVNKIELPE